DKNQTADFQDKEEILRNILRDKGADALTLSNQNDFSWLTGGRGFIGTASTGACGTAVVTKDRTYLVAENIEATRLYREQLGENPFVTVKEYPWQEPGERAKILNEICGGGTRLDAGDIGEELFEARTRMSAYDIERYRDICQTAAKDLEEVCRTLKVGVTEYELAGQLAQKFWADNLEPITLLIGFDERALRYRHPVPAGAALKNYALVAVCARRAGLIASATRLVALKNPGSEIMERQKVSAYVDAVFAANTLPGRTVGSVFGSALAAYAEKGYPDEWKFHHQGGLTGYVARELKAVSGSTHIIRENEVYAWNPSVQGTKSENTILITKDGFENLTHTGNYPYLTYEIDGRKIMTEDILILG
ncbi:MAG: M24 family metallopeptidase, partial [Ruminococcaceae bacterium]|nr:M24 family metallopeptidase [Oscillospiraceae bacterium]